MESKSANSPCSPVPRSLTLNGAILFVAKLSPKPRWFSATVQDRADAYDLGFDAIINRDGKPFTQAAMIAECFRVNSAMTRQQVDVGE